MERLTEKQIESMRKLKIAEAEWNAALMKYWEASRRENMGVIELQKAFVEVELAASAWMAALAEVKRDGDR